MRPRWASHAISFGTSLVAAATSGFEMMPTVLMSGIKQEFLVSFRAQDRTLDDARIESQALHGFRDSQARRLVQFGPAHDAAFAHLSPPHFKLWLDEYNHAALGAQKGDHRPQNQSCRDEADIESGEVDLLADIVESQASGVNPFVYHYARIVAQLPVKLPGAYIDSVDAFRPVLQQAVGEAAGGRADIHADGSIHFNFEALERCRQLHAATAHIRRFACDFDAAGRVDGVAGLQ